jgi:hypothetical protein
MYIKTRKPDEQAMDPFKRAKMYFKMKKKNRRFLLLHQKSQDKDLIGLYLARTRGYVTAMKKCSANTYR